MMNEAELKLFYEGRRLFNEGHYYEAHEEWELIWLKRVGEDRDFFQGLIILAGAFCHLKKKKYHPALLALQKAFNKLSFYLPDCHGVKLAQIVAGISNWIEWLDAREKASPLTIII